MKDGVEKFDYVPPALEIAGVPTALGMENAGEKSFPIDDSGSLPDPGGW